MTERSTGRRYASRLRDAERWIKAPEADAHRADTFRPSPRGGRSTSRPRFAAASRSPPSDVASPSPTCCTTSSHANSPPIPESPHERQ